MEGRKQESKKGRKKERKEGRKEEWWTPLMKALPALHSLSLSPVIIFYVPLYPATSCYFLLFSLILFYPILLFFRHLRHTFYFRMSNYFMSHPSLLFLITYLLFSLSSCIHYISYFFFYILYFILYILYFIFLFVRSILLTLSWMFYALFSYVYMYFSLLPSHILGYLYERLDGNTRASDRNDSVKRFGNPAFNRFIMLLSTKAGKGKK